MTADKSLSSQSRKTRRAPRFMALLTACLLTAGTACFNQAAAVELSPAVKAAYGRSLTISFSYADNRGVLEVTNTGGINALTAASLVEGEAGLAGSNGLLAEELASSLDGELYRVKLSHELPADYGALVKLYEENAAELSALDDSALPDFTAFDTILVGFPIWGGTVPAPMRAFLQAHAEDLAGKQVLVFCTHAGLGAGKSLETVKALLPHAEVADEVLAVSGAYVQRADSAITDFLTAKARK